MAWANVRDFRMALKVGRQKFTAASVTREAMAACSEEVVREQAGRIRYSSTCVLKGDCSNGVHSMLDVNRRGLAVLLRMLKMTYRSRTIGGQVNVKMSLLLP